MRVPVWLTPAEVAQILGVSVKTVYRALRAGALPAEKMGPQWRVDLRDVGAVLTPSGGTPRAVEPEPEPDEDAPEA